MKYLRPNKEGIDTLIAIIKKPKKHFIMGSFDDPSYRNKKGEACGTAYCIAGYAAVLNGVAEDAQLGTGILQQMLEPKKGYLAFLLDVPSMEFRKQVFHLWSGTGINLTDFDQMSEKKRKAIAIEVLENFAKTGKVTWRKIAKKHGYDTENDGLRQ